MPLTSPRKQRPLKVGLGLTLWNEGMDGKTPTWQDVLALGQQAEAIGFDSLWIPDNLFFRTDTGKLYDSWECWSILSALAARTSRIVLGSFVNYVGYRDPILLAKMACTVDEISAGRLVLGLGAGYTSDATEAAGFPTTERYTRLEETLILLHQLLHQGTAHFEGSCYQVRECELLLRGPREAGPPILLGSFPHPGPRLLRLAVQYANQWNGWLGNDAFDMALLPSLQEAIDDACQQHKRPPETLERSVGIGISLEGSHPGDAAFEHFVPCPVKGNPEMTAQSLLHLAHAGFSEVQVFLHPLTPAGLEAFALVLDMLDTAYL